MAVSVAKRKRPIGRSRARMSAWGNSLGVRIPKEIAAEMGLREGCEVDVETHADGVLLKPVVTRKRYTTAELCAGVTPKSAGGEIWKGPAKGREIW